jgi:hypothetical protein
VFNYFIQAGQDDDVNTYRPEDMHVVSSDVESSTWQYPAEELSN